MAKTKLSPNPKVLTGNDLRHGDVVYLARDGAWRRSIAKARAFGDPSLAGQALARALKDEANVVGAFLTDILPGSEMDPKPAHFREGFRQNGPSNRVLDGGVIRARQG